MNFPKGKGAYIWNLIAKELFDGDFVALATWMAHELKINWVSIKIADGIFPSNRLVLRDGNGNITGYDDTIIQKFIDACTRSGIEVWGWQYIYLTFYPKEEALMAISRMKKFPGLKGFILDPEIEAEKSPDTNQGVYCDTLRAGLRPETSIGLSSWRFPSLHPGMNWNAWLNVSNFHCPQVYWMQAHNPVEQLQRSAKELLEMKNMPFIPVGAMYHEQSWQPTKEEVLAFDKEAEKYPATLWWELANAVRYNMAGWFKELHGEPFPIPKPVEPTLPADYKTVRWMVWVYASSTATRANGFIPLPGTRVTVLKFENGRALMQGRGWCEVAVLREAEPVIPFLPTGMRTRTGLYVYPDATEKNKAIGHIDGGKIITVTEISGKMSKFDYKLPDGTFVNAWVYSSGLVKA